MSALNLLSGESVGPPLGWGITVFHMSCTSQQNWGSLLAQRLSPADFCHVSCSYSITFPNVTAFFSDFYDNGQCYWLCIAKMETRKDKHWVLLLVQQSPCYVQFIQPETLPPNSSSFCINGCWEPSYMYTCFKCNHSAFTQRLGDRQAPVGNSFKRIIKYTHKSL